MTTTEPVPDKAAQLARSIAVLDTFDALPEAVTLRQRIHDLLDLRLGEPAVDIGCGAGRAVAELAARGAAASGVDIDEGMVATARQRYPEHTFHVATADALPYGDGAIRGYRAEKVYHALTDPAGALTEARRVLAPGGRIVLAGQDWGALVLDTDDMPTTRALIAAQADAIPSPYAARQYRNLLRHAGFTDVATEVHTGMFDQSALLTPMLTGLAAAGTAAGTVTSEQAQDWLAEQEHRGRVGRFFCMVPIFVASARRP